MLAIDNISLDTIGTMLRLIPGLNLKPTYPTNNTIITGQYSISTYITSLCICWESKNQ